MKNSNPAFVKILQTQSAAPPPWSRPLCFPPKRLEKCWKTFSAVLRLTSDRAPWCPNLGGFKWQAWLSKWGILSYNRTAWLLHGRGAKEEESKFSSNPQWCHWPVTRLWPTPVNPCKSDASNLWRWLEYHTFKFRKQPEWSSYHRVHLTSRFFLLQKHHDSWLPPRPALAQSGKTVWWLPD